MRVTILLSSQKNGCVVTTIFKQSFNILTTCVCPVCLFTLWSRARYLHSDCGIAMKSVVDIHGPQWMNSNVFSDLLTLSHCDM